MAVLRPDLWANRSYSLRAHPASFVHINEGLECPISLLIIHFRDEPLLLTEYSLCIGRLLASEGEEEGRLKRWYQGCIILSSKFLSVDRNTSRVFPMSTRGA